MIDKNDPRLTDFVLGELNEADGAEIQDAIAQSPTLEKAVQEIRQTVELLGAAYQTESPLRLRDEQKAQLAQTRVNDAKVQSKRASTQRPWLPLALAASLMGLLIGGALYMQNRPLDPGVAKRIEQVGKLDKVELERLKDKSAASDEVANLNFFENLLMDDGTDQDTENFAWQATEFAPDDEVAGLRFENGSLDNQMLKSEALEEAKESGFSLGDSVNDGDEADAALRAGSRLEMARGRSEAIAGREVPLSADRPEASGEIREIGRDREESSQSRSQDYFGDLRAQEESRFESDEFAPGLATKFGFAEQDLGSQGPAWSFGLDANESTDEPADIELNEEAVLAAEPESQLSGGRSFKRSYDGRAMSESAIAGGDPTSRARAASPAKPAGVKDLIEGTLGETIAPAGGRDPFAGKAPGSVKSGPSGPRLDDGNKNEAKKLALWKRDAKVRQARTWKRVKAIPNTTRLMVGDKDELDLTGMQVNVQVDGFRARVLIDCFYYNDRDRQLEGNFKLRLPDDASLYYFAFGESAYDLQPQGKLAKEEFFEGDTQFVSLGAPEIRAARKEAWENVKEARMVPREKAAHAYRETVRRKVDPALVEWSGAGVFNARVFPLAPQKLHRVVIGYDVNLTKADGDWVYELDLPEQPGQCQVDLNVQSIEGVQYSVEPESDPVESVVGGKTLLGYRFQGPQENGIRLAAGKCPELLLRSGDETEGDFWGIQMTPELPVEEVAGNPRAIFLVDTSLSSNPDKFNVWLKLLESTLESNRDSLRQFNVLFFNVDAHFWQEKWVDNTQENVVELMEVCDTLALEGATDLYGAIEKITTSDWIDEPANESAAKRKLRPDLFLLSDGAANWGETNLRLMGRQMQNHRLGSLFAYQTGLTGTAISGLRFLAGQSGGAVFSVATEDEIKSTSTAHRKRPWKLTSIAADGATDIMTAGRVEWVYPGQSITVVGRGKIEQKLTLELEQAGQTRTITVTPKRVESELASRLYGEIAVGQLESLGAKVFDVAASYARHFRVTGDSCSLLMLESEADYKRFDIKPQEDLFVIKSKAVESLVAETLKKSASELADPKAQLVSWLQRLESMPGMTFKMPTALRLAMEEIQVVAISEPLDCRLTISGGLSKEYLAAIEKERLNYELIAAEARRRGETSVDEAIKVFSSLVERNPGDPVIARDVAYTALELGRPAQAYHLLRNVARARPFEGSIYLSLGQCLAQLGQADMAIVYYEVALEGKFNRTGNDFKKIVSAEYMHLLRQIVAGDLESSVNDFAKARLATLTSNLDFESAKLLITMMWNTDQTDVDLHVFEPSGEECSYENKTTRTGGSITSDIRTGFGPEMYVHPDAPNGKYDIKVQFFASDQDRTELRNKVYLTIYRGFGSSDERVTRKTIQMEKVGEKESVATVGVEK